MNTFSTCESRSGESLRLADTCGTSFAFISTEKELSPPTVLRSFLCCEKSEGASFESPHSSCSLRIQPACSLVPRDLYPWRLTRSESGQLYSQFLTLKRNFCASF
jgi:hypothetical protein